MFIAYDYEQGGYGFISARGEYSQLKEEDMDEFFIELIQKHRKQGILWWFGINYCIQQILYILWHMGFNDVTRDAKPIKQWKTHDFDYTIGDDGRVFRVRVKTYDKSTLYIYNADNIIGKDIQSIINNFSTCTNDRLANLTYGAERAISELVGAQTKQTPFTISMIAQKQWRILDDIPFKCDELVDCNAIISPVQNEMLDEYLRRSYKGGWNYLSPLASGILHDGVVLDVNSLYPYCAYSKPIPWGDPTYFYKEIPENVKDNDKFYYYVRFRCTFRIKDGYLPFISIRGDFRYKQGESLESSDYISRDGKRSSYYIDNNGERKKIKPTMTLSKTDFELFLKVYDVEDMEILDGCFFRTIRSAFRGTISEHYNGKLEATKRKDKASRTIHKMIMNALIGTFAKEQEHTSLIFDFSGGEPEIDFITTHSQSKSYIHIASAVLSYAREYIYSYAMKCKDRFLYCDTDSLHLLGTDIPRFIPVSDKLGEFKIEKTFKYALYMKRKCYILIDKDMHSMVTIAGLTKDYREYLECLLDACNTYDSKVAKKYFSMGIYISTQMEKGGFNREIRPQIKEMTYDDWSLGRSGTKIEVPLKSDYYNSFHKFEENIAKCETIEERLFELYYGSIPNGFRECTGWHSELVGEWFSISNSKF